jgi:hypothetical protein
MKVSKIRDLTVDNASHPGRPSHVSAASGLVRVGATLYVVADDELHLGVFPADDDAPGHLLRMRAGDLPTTQKARKKVKPDFEALAYLPGFGQFPQSALLALGSGSRKGRCLGVLIPLNGDVAAVQMARPIDASELFAQLATEVDELNVEGAFVLDDRLLLLHRGNKSHSYSAIFTIDLRSAIESMYSKGVLSALPIQAVSHYELAAIRTEYGKFDDYMNYLGTTWQASQEATAKNDAIAKQVEGSLAAANQSAVDRGTIRRVLGSWTGQELVLK